MVPAARTMGIIAPTGIHSYTTRFERASLPGELKAARPSRRWSGCGESGDKTILQRFGSVRAATERVGVDFDAPLESGPVG